MTNSPLATTTARARRREAVPVWLARILALCSIISLIGVVFYDTSTYSVVYFLVSFLPIPVGPSIFLAALLMVLAGPIRRRFRAAHTVLVVIIVGTLVLLTLLIGYEFFENDPLGEGQPATLADKLESCASLAIGLVILAIVLWARPVFTVRMAGRAIRDAVLILISGLVLSFAVTFAIVSLHRSQYGTHMRFRWALNMALGNTVSPNLPQVGPHWVTLLAGAIAGAAVVGSLLVLWRAERHSARLNAEDELVVRAMVLEYGDDDSLAYFATRRDKDVVFSPDHRAAIAFRSHGNVSVASGDPLGDPQSWPAAVSAWLNDARAHGRYAAVLSASSTAAELYNQCGLRALALGDEAVIDTQNFRLSGRSMRPVRQAVNRVERAGYTAEVRRHCELSPEELSEVARLAEAWRGDDPERGFSMALGRFGDPSDGRCVVALARDTKGEIKGLLSFVPWGRRGLSLDLMRRAPDAENGVNEFLVANLVRGAEQLGIRRISLNFAVFRRVFSDADEVGAGPITKLSGSLLSVASRFYQLDSLYRSNEKYDPLWVPRMLCYDPTLTAPRAAFAMGVAEGFIPTPSIPFVSRHRPRNLEQSTRDSGFAEQVRELERRLSQPSAPAPKLNEQQRVRLNKYGRMADAGREGYPLAVPRDHSIAEAVAVLREAIAAKAEAGSATTARIPNLRTGTHMQLSGRVRALRDFGGVAFAVIEEAGSRIQVIVDSSVTPADQARDWRRWVDLGDVVSVSGELVTSRSGEPSLLINTWRTAAKCLNPMPDLYSTLAEDARTRQRVLDLITSEDSLDFLRRRALGVQALRATLVSEGYLEVETPMLQQVHGGASARPFITHINAYDMNLYLRIAPELYLKRLAVAGMGRIFEVGRNFRNEGADATHNPEFTACEVYAAYSDYVEMRHLTRRIILAVAEAVNGRPVAFRPDGQGGVTEIDLTPEWPVMTIHEAVSQASGHALTAASTRAEVAAACREHGVDVLAEQTPGQLVMELYDALVEKQTTFPTFYCDFPQEVSPLARPHRSVPGLTEQWDLVGFGAELGCAYSELTDPVDQRERLTAQSLAAAAGDPEAMQLDEDFLEALGYGMPPTGGLGVGVDRIVMLLLGQQIRATLAFPFVRPR